MVRVGCRANGEPIKMNNREAIRYLLKDYEPQHSNFQIDNFIVGQEPSRWFRYKQALREIHTRAESMDRLYDELSLANLELERIKKRGRWPRITKRSRLRYHLKLKRAEKALHELNKKRLQINRELQRFVSLALDLKEKHFNDLTADKRAALESQAWLDKAKRMAALDLFFSGHISRQTADFIFSLPAADRRDVFALTKSRESVQKLLMD